MEGHGDTENSNAHASPAISRGNGVVTLDTITTRECVDLLRESTVGRLGVTNRAMPMILPVNFQVYNDWVVVRTVPGSTMAEAARNSVVAFEVDQADFSKRTGWSVVVVGHASLISGGPVFETLCGLDLLAWAPHEEDGFLVIKMERVSGRRLAIAAESGAGIQK